MATRLPRNYQPSTEEKFMNAKQVQYFRLKLLNWREEILKESLFGERKNAEVIIGYYNKEPVGFALFFHNFSTFLGKNGIYLEDLYVKPEMRGKGFGKTLLSHLAKLAKERDCGRLEWWVLDWNKPAIDFYKKIGAKPMDEWTVFRLTGEDLDKTAKN